MMSGQASNDNIVHSTQSKEPETKMERLCNKRPRAPETSSFVSDYRPYSGKQLQRALVRRGNEENHKRQWDVYYRNNNINGYKDRHYILREFHELREVILEAEAQHNTIKNRKGTINGNEDSNNIHYDENTESTLVETTLKQENVIKEERELSKPVEFTWLEAGCGVGNAFLPIFEEYGHLPLWHNMLGFDISSEAIRLLKTKQDKLSPALACKMNVIVLDPTKESIYNSSLFQDQKKYNNIHVLDHSCTCEQLNQEEKEKLLYHEEYKEEQNSHPQRSCKYKSISATFVSLVFVLCSMPIHTHRIVIDRIKECMTQPGGVLFFRDYAVDDHAAVRFAQRHVHQNHDIKNYDGNKNIDDSLQAESYEGTSTEITSQTQHTFRRCNGTLSHFFDEDEVRTLFTSAGFAVRELTVIERNVINRKTSASLSRRFIQGRFVLL